MNNIVVIAHDAKKPELVEFIEQRLDWFKGINLIATGRTAEFIESQGLTCRHMSPGRSGGYIQITQLIEEDKVDMVIFLHDHKVVQKPHEDIRKLLEVCTIKNIPLATNYASAELLILGLLKKQSIERSQRQDNI